MATLERMTLHDRVRLRDLEEDVVDLRDENYLLRRVLEDYMEAHGGGSLGCGCHMCATARKLLEDN